MNTNTIVNGWHYINKHVTLVQLPLARIKKVRRRDRHKLSLDKKHVSELRSCVKVEVAVLGSHS